MSIHALGISRFFQCFEFADGQALDDNMMEDIRVLASMHIRSEVERLFVTPLFGVEYSWTKDIVLAVQAFADFLIDNAERQMVLLSDDMFLNRCVATLNLMKKLKRGFAKRIADQKRERVRDRRALDQRRLEGQLRLDQIKSGLPCAIVVSLNVCLSFIFHSEFAN